MAYSEQDLSPELSERKKLILKAIVDAHIADGEPVGSKYLMEMKQIPCSSATIRNEMAELEAMGYLEQPHTSAGRVPSERGYRFYVDSLIEHYAMTAREMLAEKGLPKDLADILRYSDEESLKIAIDKIKELKSEDTGGYTLINGGQHRLPESNYRRETTDYSLKRAFGLAD